MFFASECTKQTSTPSAGDAVNNRSLSKERTVMDNFQWSGKQKLRFSMKKLARHNNFVH